jgi:hypothetical protein
LHQYHSVIAKKLKEKRRASDADTPKTPEAVINVTTKLGGSRFIAFHSPDEYGNTHEIGAIVKVSLPARSPAA